jgi:RNA polymerase sigma factor (sigma-70 family)
MKHDGEEPGDLTLISLFVAGEEESLRQRAATVFANRYLQKLTALIEQNLDSRLGNVFSAEDVANSALGSWFQGVRKRQLKPADTDEIWPLISVIALNKVRTRVRFHHAQRRDARREAEGYDDFEEVTNPTVEEAVEFRDSMAAVASRLSPQANEVFQLVLQGYSVAEIADRLDVVTRTIRRRKLEIRQQLILVLPEAARTLLSSDDQED